MREKLVTKIIYDLLEEGNIEKVMSLKHHFMHREVSNTGHAYIKGIHYVTEKLDEKEEDEAMQNFLKLYYYIDLR